MASYEIADTVPPTNPAQSRKQDGRYAVAPGGKPGTWAVITMPHRSDDPGQVVLSGLHSRFYAEHEAGRLNGHGT